MNNVTRAEPSAAGFVLVEAPPERIDTQAISLEAPILSGPLQILGVCYDALTMLTKQDLGKIKAVVDAGHEVTRAHVDRRVDELKETMATKDDVTELETRLSTKIDRIQSMLAEDHQALVSDVETLKVKVAFLRRRR